LAQSRPAPVTLPKFAFIEADVKAEVREAQTRLLERKAIRAGLDAWRSIGKAECFESWKVIGAALSIGKAHALRVTGANQAWGSSYSRVFGEWMAEHGFSAMPKSTRSHAIELSENIIAIEAWRSTLTEQRRRRLQGPQHNVLQWRRETGQVQNKRSNAITKAETTMRHFLSCMAKLAPDEAAPLWQAVHAEAVLHV